MTQQEAKYQARRFAMEILQSGVANPTRWDHLGAESKEMIYEELRKLCESNERLRELVDV